MSKHDYCAISKPEILSLGQGKLINILDFMEDGVYIVNQQHEVEYTNLALQLRFGPVNERKCFQYFHNNEEPCPWCYNKNIFAGKTVCLKWYAEKNQKTYEVILSPLRDVNGKLSKLGIFHDITKPKKTRGGLGRLRHYPEESEEKFNVTPIKVIKKFEHKLTGHNSINSKLERLYNQERDLRSELEAQISQRIEFTRALVHELKTPLTALVAASDLLVASIIEEPNATLIKNIQMGTINLDKRIGELFDLARGEVGILKLKRSPIDLLPLFQHVVDYVTPEADTKQQSLVLNLPSSLPIVIADEDRLQQVLLNLLGNAIKFTPRGGRITLEVRQEDSNVLVEVQDTGPGISKDRQKRLFKPYYWQKSDENQFSGLGLGLALCQTLVQLHGGRIWAKKHEGNGSTFSFSLPIAEQQSV